MAFYCWYAFTLGNFANYHTVSCGCLRSSQAFQDLQDWSNLIARLNGAVLEYLGTPYEERLISAANPPDALRQAIIDVFVDAYLDMGESVTIHVIPLTDGAIGTLDDPLAAKIRLSRADGEDVVVIREGTGIAIHHRDDGFGTLIVPEGREGYEVTLEKEPGRR